MLALAGLIAAAAAQAETIKVGILKVGASGPLYIAQDRGYFAAEGLTVDLANFGAGQAVAVAVVSGDIDIGVTGLTAGLYNLASGGQIRVVAGLHREAHGFRMLGYFASKRAYDAGLTSLADIKGHSVAISTIGSTTHYAVGLLAMKYGFPIASVRIMPLQSFSNSAAAVIGGQADVGMIPSTLNAEMHKAGAKNLGWVGDETPWQIGGVFVTTATANDRPEFVERFLRAYVKGAHDYYAAFSAPDGSRRDGPTAPETLAIIAKYTGESAENIKRAVGFVDPEGRFDEADILHQIAWYKSQNMLKDGVDGATVIDRRYVPPLPPQPER